MAKVVRLAFRAQFVCLCPVCQKRPPSFSFMRYFLEDDDVLYNDLPGKCASKNPLSTVPLSIVATSARPKMVLITSMEVILIELTVPCDSRENLNNIRARK